MYDVIIIGSGVSGSAAARELSRYKAKDMCIRKRRRCLLWNVKSQQWNCTCRI